MFANSKKKKLLKNVSLFHFQHSLTQPSNASFKTLSPHLVNKQCILIFKYKKS